MSTQLSDAGVSVNNEAVAIVPNSIKYTEGFGEQKVRAASVGGGEVEQVYSHDVESNFSMVSFEIYATVEAIKLARSWKAARNANVVQITGSTPDGSLTRTFTQAGLLGNYDVELGADTTITLEFNSNPAI